MRARLRLDGDRFDKRADFLLGGALGLARRVHADGDGLEHIAQDFAIERRLAGEVVIDHRLVDARGAGDAIDIGAGEASRRKFGGGRSEHAGDGMRHCAPPAGDAPASGLRLSSPFTK